MMTFSQLRREARFPDSISRDVHERRKLRILSKWLYKAVGSAKQPFSVPTDEVAAIFDYVRLCQTLFALSREEPRQTSWANIKGMLNVFMSARVNQTPIQFVSVASNALTIDGKLKDKSQYLKFDRISRLLELTMPNVPYTYEVFLADTDYRFERSKYESSWQENFSYLRRSTAVPTRRLSDIFGSLDSVMAAVNETNGCDFDREAAHFQDNGTLRLFDTSLPRARHQMALYAAIGLMLQERFPTGILLDVQGKIYAYEQPYYQRGRASSPIPVFRIGHH